MKVSQEVRDALQKMRIHDLKPDERIWMRDFLMSLVQAGSTMSNEWGMETIKHLAVVNGGGLAGAFAMFSAPNKFPGASPESAAQLFFLGLFVAFMTLVFSYWVAKSSTRRAAEVIAEYVNGSAPGAALLDLEPKWGIRCVYATAVLSLLLFVLGIAFLTPFDLSVTNAIRNVL